MAADKKDKNGRSPHHVLEIHCGAFYGFSAHLLFMEHLFGHPTPRTVYDKLQSVHGAIRHSHHISPGRNADKLCKIAGTKEEKSNAVFKGTYGCGILK
jgi:hypothetical protein